MSRTLYNDAPRRLAVQAGHARRGEPACRPGPVTPLLRHLRTLPAIVPELVIYLSWLLIAVYRALAERRRNVGAHRFRTARQPRRAVVRVRSRRATTAHPADIARLREAGPARIEGRCRLSGEQDACQWRSDVTVTMRYCADGDNGAGWDDDRLG